jgi:hypothetical protein
MARSTLRLAEVGISIFKWCDVFNGAPLPVGARHHLLHVFPTQFRANI